METPDEASRKLVRNEQLKLGATLCNTIAAAFIVTGVVIQVIAMTYHTAVPQGRYWAIYTVVWLAVAALIHPSRWSHIVVEDEGVTFLEIYGLAAPVVVAALLWAYVLWVIRH